LKEDQNFLLIQSYVYIVHHTFYLDPKSFAAISSTHLLTEYVTASTNQCHFVCPIAMKLIVNVSLIIMSYQN